MTSTLRDDLGPSVLLVDNDAAAREIHADFLRNGGFTVVEAATGDAAVAELARELPSVIILDLALPDIDGRRLGMHWKHGPRTRHVPIVAVTSWPIQFEEIERYGFSAALLEPVDREDLVGVCRRLLREVNLQQAIRPARAGAYVGPERRRAPRPGSR